MDDHWYYAESSDRSHGPMNIEELGQILRSRANSIDFLVWCPGMPNWARAGDQFALRRYLGPPPIPTLHASQPSMPRPPQANLELRSTLPDTNEERLRPWRRYFARMFDLYLFSIVFFVLLGIAVPQLFASSDKGLDALYGIFAAAAYAIFEGFSLNVFGSSLGKKLYGIRLHGPDVGSLPLSLSFKRSFAVWARGLGVGIPIATLFTLIFAYQTLKKDGQTSWDRDFQCTVSHQELSGFRWFSIVAIWIALIFVYGALVALGNSTT